MFWPIQISHSQVAVRLGHLLNMPPERCVVPWYEANSLIKGCDSRIIIADPYNTCLRSQYALIIEDEINERTTVCSMPNRDLAPFQLLQGKAFGNDQVSVKHNGTPVQRFHCVKISNGDVISIGFSDEIAPTAAPSKKAKTQTALDDRIDLMKQHGIALASDEMEFVIRLMRACSIKHVNICDVLYADDDHFGLVSYEKFFQFCQLRLNNQDEGTCAILHNNHWALLEMTWNQDAQHLMVSFLNTPTELSNMVFKCLQKASLFCNVPIAVESKIITVDNGYCGWAIIHRWLKELRAQNPKVLLELDNLCPVDFVKSITNDFCFESASSIAHFVVSLGCAGFGDGFDSLFKATTISKVATWVRSQFIAQLPTTTIDKLVKFGSTGEKDAEMPQTKKEDPWSKVDPWAPVGSSSSTKQCRWEDLLLPDDHPIFAGENRLKQVHRRQLSPNVSGAAFTTKSQVAKIIQTKPKSPFVLLLLAGDKNKFHDLSLDVAATTELIVKDSNTGSIYKKQVSLVTSDKNVKIKLATPQYQATVTEMREVVFELFRSTMHKDAFNMVAEKPTESFKHKLVEQYGSQVVDKLQLYGFRKVFDNNAKDQVHAYQIMAKTSVDIRTKLLNLSGAGDVFVRDFLDRSMKQNDLCILPRYWSADRAGREQAFRTGASAEGFAGLVSLRKGIAIRGWSSKVKEIRTIVLAQDPRYVPLNISVVPTTFLESKGWPISLGPSDVVAAIHHACGKPCVPGRCFRSQGVVTWTVGFASPPDTRHFTASFNGQTHEILITEAMQPPPLNPKGKPAVKGKGKGNFNQSTNVEQNANIVEHERIAKLESRMGTMEKRQDQIENRITDGLHHPKQRKLVNISFDGACVFLLAIFTKQRTELH